MYLAIDYGKKRIGLATGSIIPRGAGVLDGSRPELETFLAIKKICDAEDIEKIIIGLPIRSQGEEGTLAREIKSFANRLSEFTGRAIIFEPEQFTSSEAEYQLQQADQRVSRQSGKTDELAAILILEQFLRSVKE